MLYRKRPVVIVIEANIFRGGAESAAAIINWVLNCDADLFVAYDANNDVLKITTLEDVMTATPGDFIIRGASNEFYPCKPDIFEATYEAVD